MVGQAGAGVDEANRRVIPYAEFWGGLRYHGWHLRGGLAERLTAPVGLYGPFESFLYDGRIGELDDAK